MCARTNKNSNYTDSY
jgi:serum/glucocorticoid-regulated kinase 2